MKKVELVSLFLLFLFEWIRKGEFMFLARDKKGHLINALENEVKRQAYYCPACRTSVRLKKGKNVRTHFAHESLKSCDFLS